MVVREGVGEVMKAREFLKQVHHQEVVAAIRSAEMKTSGEIRVFVSHKEDEDPVSAAKSHFLRLKMDQTRERNAVLLFVAPRSQNFAVIGDTGVHARCGDEFWRELSADLSFHFRKSEFTAGLVRGIDKAGQLLAKHFPRLPDDHNELPDAVEHD